MRLSGKKTLIVGASSGVGAEVARLFASAGSALALVARSRDKLAALAEELGDGTTVVIGDVGDDASCEAIVPAAIGAMGGIDIAIYSAGLAEPCRLEDLTLESFRRHVDVNLTGNFIVARAAALHMRERQGGSIVSIASELSHVGMALYAPYCAAKAGMLGLTRALAAEMAPTVRVNAVSPGPIDTPMLQAELDWFGGSRDVMDAALARVPLKRFATAREVAEAVLFLAVDARYATGSTIRLDGGTTMV